LLEILPIVAVLSGFGLLFLWLAYSTHQSWRVLQRATANALPDPHIDATLQPVRRRALLLGTVAALFFLSAVWVGWRGAGVTNANPPPRVPREVPRALWTLAAPFYASLVLAASGFVLGFIAAAAPKLGRRRLTAHEPRVETDQVATASFGRRAAAAGGAVVCLAASVWFALRGFAGLRTLTAPQRAVFSDCDPVPAGFAALMGVAWLALFLAEGVAVWRGGPPARGRRGRRVNPRVPWSTLWLALALLVAGYYIFVGSCEYPGGSS
jgi:hypothetical protein